MCARGHRARPGTPGNGALQAALDYRNEHEYPQHREALPWQQAAILMGGLSQADRKTAPNRPDNDVSSVNDYALEVSFCQDSGCSLSAQGVGKEGRPATPRATGLGPSAWTAPTERLRVRPGPSPGHLGPGREGCITDLEQSHLRGGKQGIHVDDLLGGLLDGASQSGGDPLSGLMGGLLGGSTQPGGSQIESGVADSAGLGGIPAALLGGSSGAGGLAQLLAPVAEQLMVRLGLSSQVADAVVAFVLGELVGGRAGGAEHNQGRAVGARRPTASLSASGCGLTSTYEGRRRQPARSRPHNRRLRPRSGGCDSRATSPLRAWPAA